MSFILTIIKVTRSLHIKQDMIIVRYQFLTVTVIQLSFSTNGCLSFLKYIMTCSFLFPLSENKSFIIFCNLVAFIAGFMLGLFQVLVYSKYSEIIEIYCTIFTIKNIINKYSHKTLINRIIF